MQEIDVKIDGEYIELYKLLKWAGVVESGALAKVIVDSKAVYLNGKVEFRKRKKIYPNDKVIFQDFILNIRSK